MKKILLFLTVLAMSIVSYGVSIQFGAGTGANRHVYDGTTLMSNANGYSVTAYLIFLGDNASDAWATFDVASFAATGPTVTALSTTAGTAIHSANVAANGAFLPGSANKVPNASPYTDGEATFGVLYIAKIAEGSTFSDGTTADHYFKTDWFVYDTTAPAKGSYTAGTVTYLYAQALPSGTTWTSLAPDTPEPPVPEPATASIALAGLALLFKRRKA